MHKSLHRGIRGVALAGDLLLPLLQWIRFLALCCLRFLVARRERLNATESKRRIS